MRAALLALLAAGAWGCGWSPGLDGLQYACPDQRCPAGLVCLEGLCQAPPADGPPSGCTGSTVFTERFEAALDPAVWDTFPGGGTATATGGVLELAWTEWDTQIEIGMVNRYLTDGMILTIEVDAPSDISSSRAWVHLYDDDLGDAQIMMERDTFDLSATINPDTTFGFDVAPARTYQPQADRFWRIRRGGGEICFETASEATGTYALFGCGSDADVRAELRVSLGAQNYASEAAVERRDDLVWCGP